MPPYHRNFNKRLVKTPKLYFHDTGLVAWLLGIESARQLSTHPLREPLFETWVVGEFLKRRLNTGRPSNLSFWRDRSGHEVDLLVESPEGIQAVEIKSTATPTADALRGLDQWRTMTGQSEPRPCLIYGGDTPQRRTDSDIIPWRLL
jgi:predicted AAA+ superfamily ATPase